MSIEIDHSNQQNPNKITPGDKAIAVVSGLLIGSGVIFPAAFVLGAGVGAVGEYRVWARKRNSEAEGIATYFRENY